MASQEFSGVTGATFEVPAGVTEVTITAEGGRGQQIAGGSNAGNGGRAVGTFTVTPEETLQVNAPTAANTGELATQGGRAADVRRGGTTLADRIIVGAGGGSEGRFSGATGISVSRGGGHGGATTGADGSGSTGGGGGTQSAGGAAGTGATQDGTAGSLGFGGNGASGDDGNDNSWEAGAGGDGYYGGGGGGASVPSTTEAGGGGGGSNFIDGSATGTLSQRGVRSTLTSYVLIEWDDAVVPDAPVLVTPVDGETVASGDVTFEWDHSHPQGDSQTGWAVQVREQGETALTHDLTDTGGAQSVDANLTAGDFEWRARTESDAGWGPWTGWEPFATVDPPGAPNITDPDADNQVITEGSYTYLFAATSWEAIRAWRRADDAGEPGDVLWESGTITEAGTTSGSVTVDHPDNLQFEHVEIAIREDGLWSPRASRRVEVDWEPPATPTLSLTAADGYAHIDVTNPSGGATVVHNEVWRRGGPDDGTGIRIAILDPDGQHDDYTVHSGVDHEFRVVAISDTGTTAASVWTA